MSRAFTLIEVLITLAIVAVLSGGVAGFIRDMRVQQREMLRWSEDSAAADALIESLERDLMTSIAMHRDQAGVKGDREQITVISRGVLADAPNPSAGLITAEYRLDGTQLLARRGMAGAMNDVRWETLSTRIARLSIRYHDGHEWRTSYDSSADGLPRAVEVALWFENPTPKQADPEDQRAQSEPRQWSDPDRLRVIAIPDGGDVEPTP